MEKINPTLKDLKARLFKEHGTDEVKLENPVKTGKEDWRAGGGDPTCTKVRAKSETEFEWYLNDWAYGWYGEDEYCNGVEYPNHLSNKLKIRILKQALKSDELKMKMLEQTLNFDEDEKIRDMLIGWVKLKRPSSFEHGLDKEKIIEWLKKK